VVTTLPQHRTAREKVASESARIAVARAQAHAARKADPEPVAEPVTPAATSDEPTTSAAAWRRRCRQIREEIDAERNQA
jgi:hypothetical protein